MLRKTGNQSLQGTRHFGLGTTIVLALGVALIAAVGNVAIVVFSLGTGLAIGTGFLIGTVLCELVNRRNR
jgi:hypothetical protein